ncbi:hypothetical protein G8764_16705 [Pseudomaricurvus alcaniphilus]|uniref:hypothetical protein n=1 Tax=Pseudomaricurvus alcaniphilus TaxID=1166482 RepID=UPI001409DE3F|nr:hypothetical protein [Pseudomaricurvus alcaniphilus]NHN38951.1 hypothetical protein [Pseudomaricurvus alcaniphilus]
MEELGIISVFKELFEFAETNFSGYSKWQKYRERFREYAAQATPKATKYNFSHRGTYITCYRGLAVKYAVESPCGSELLQQLNYLAIAFNFLGHRESAVKIVPTKIREIMSKQYDPVLLELNEVYVDQVETETGANKEKQIDDLSEALSHGVFPPWSFKLRWCHPKTRFKEELLGTRRVENGKGMW